MRLRSVWRFPAQVPNRLWQLGKLNHVAIAVPNLEKATALYRDVMGAAVSEPQVRGAPLRTAQPRGTCGGSRPIP